MFELYATRMYSVASLRQLFKAEYGKVFTKWHLEKLLKNSFYVGTYEWEGKSYAGTLPPLVSPEIFSRVRDVLSDKARPRKQKHEFAFSCLLGCAYDKCAVTAEFKKQKYTYYRCTGYRGKCDLPYFREEVIAERLGHVLQAIHIPDDVLAQLEESCCPIKPTRKRSGSSSSNEWSNDLPNSAGRWSRRMLIVWAAKLPRKFGKRRPPHGRKRNRPF
jgi:site-specific DNA recombinase